MTHDYRICPVCGGNSGQGCYGGCAVEEVPKLRAEVERLNKSRKKWGQKYNKLLEKHKITLSDLKMALWCDSEECNLLTAEVERLTAALEKIESGLPAGSSLINAKNPLWRDAYRDLQRIARIALHEDKENG